MGSSTLSATTPSSPSAIPHSRGLGVLPSRRSDDAPCFDSNHPEDLEDFLLEVDTLANTHGLEDEEKVYLAVRYADSRAKRIWKVADGYEEEVSKCDWSKFKKDLTEVLYNSSDKTRYLENVVRRWKKREMSDKECLGAYNREFIPLLRKFKKKGFINEMEERHWFWKGIERGTRRRIANRLCLLDKDWDGYSPPPVADVAKAGLLVLGARLENSEDDSEEEECSVRRSKRVAAEPSVTTVDLAAALLIGQTAALQSMLVFTSSIVLLATTAAASVHQVLNPVIQSGRPRSHNHRGRYYAL